MATFLAHIKVHEGREAEFEILARDLFASTHTSEEQVVRYEYWRGAKPSTYYTHASFDDYLGFLEHQVSSHHERLAADLRDVILAMAWSRLSSAPLRMAPPTGTAGRVDPNPVTNLRKLSGIAKFNSCFHPVSWANNCVSARISLSNSKIRMR